MKVPTAVHTGEWRIGPIVMRCHVLDDGRAVIDAESVDAFMRWLESPDVPTDEVRRFTAEFAAWLREVAAHGEKKS